MRYGTSHFVDYSAACRYYRAYGLSVGAVDRKIAAGEIHIGPPAIPQDYALSVIPGEGRYQLELIG